MNALSGYQYKWHIGAHARSLTVRERRGAWRKVKDNVHAYTVHTVRNPFPRTPVLCHDTLWLRMYVSSLLAGHLGRGVEVGWSSWPDYYGGHRLERCGNQRSEVKHVHTCCSTLLTQASSSINRSCSYSVSFKGWRDLTALYTFPKKRSQRVR